MAVLFFSGGMQAAENRVRRIIKDVGQKTEIYRSLNTLSIKFHKPRKDLSHMIFLAPNRETLLELLLIRNQMYDLPIILILPDKKKETILKGHKFYPRFITFMDSNYSDLEQYLYKTINYEKRSFNMSDGEVVPTSTG